MIHPLRSIRERHVTGLKGFHNPHGTQRTQGKSLIGTRSINTTSDQALTESKLLCPRGKF